MKTDDVNNISLHIPTLEEIGALMEEKLKGFTFVKDVQIGEQDEYLDMEGVRLILGGGNGKMMCKSTVNNLRTQGIIKAYKIGSGRNAPVRFKKSEVLQAMETKGVGEAYRKRR